MSLEEKQIIESWHSNASAWDQAIKNGEIESRVLVTNQAILETVQGLTIDSAIDIGCGEGWLSNRLQLDGIEMLGIDVVPQLIARAAIESGASFKVAHYERFSRQPLDKKFDAALCNFSLLGKTPVEELMQNLHNLIKIGGYLIIQTLHPLSEHTAERKDGWLPGNWNGFNHTFKTPAPWYFRTLESWIDLFANSGLKLIRQYQPTHPVTGEPASIILVGQLKPAGRSSSTSDHP